MTWRTHKITLGLRNAGRVLGLNRFFASLVADHDYEDRFQLAMLAAIRPGDIVWDVGANVGLYSKIFAGIAGFSGKVIAFEPSPANLRRLNQAVAPLGNVAVAPFALGEREGTVFLEQGVDSLGATSRIVTQAPTESLGRAAIRLASGDYLISSGVVETPNVIKIDTEGFELEVLRGLSQTLQQDVVRALCIEIHFGLLKERGCRSAPADIEKLLVSYGFSVVWPDASHIVATRIN